MELGPADKNDDRAANDLINELESLPLRLELAAACIQEEAIDYQRYLMGYRQYSPPGTREPFTSVIGLSFERLSKPSSDLLKLCCFFNPDEIPFELMSASLT